MPSHDDYLKSAKRLSEATLDELCDPEKLVPVMVEGSISGKSLYYMVNDTVVRVRVTAETIRAVESLQRSIETGNETATRLQRAGNRVAFSTAVLTFAMAVLAGLQVYRIFNP